MRAFEFLSEKYNQANADKALHTAMVTIVQYWRKKLMKTTASPWASGSKKNSEFRALKNEVERAIYSPYMRKSFNDTPAPYTSQEWEKLITSFAHPYPEYDVSATWNSSGHLEFTNNSEYSRNNKIKDAYKEKLYFTIDPTIPLDKIPPIIQNLIKYLADDNSGIMKFKINGQNDVNSEVDTLCVYVEKGADGKKEYNNIKRIFPSSERSHRADMGHDHDSFGLNPFADEFGKGFTGRDSDSGIRYSRFAEFLINSSEYVNQLLTKNSDSDAANYLANLWKTKFAKERVFDAPVPPIKVSTTSDSAPKPTPDPDSPPRSTTWQPTEKSLLTLTSNGVKVLGVNVTANIGKAVLKNAGDDVKYYSNHQFTLTKMPGNKWSISPGNSTNQTIVNGKALTTTIPLVNGMKISVGNTAKSIEKLPLIVHIA